MMALPNGGVEHEPSGCVYPSGSRHRGGADGYGRAGGAADDKAAAVERGRVLVADRCALCHATGARGESPKPTAPPLRRLAERYPDAALTEAFEKGLLERHPAMPPFRFSRDDLTAILAYLHSIHEVRGA